MNYREIKRYLEGKADASYEWSDLDCIAKPNREMSLLGKVEDFEDGRYDEEEMLNDLWEYFKDEPYYDVIHILTIINQRIFALDGAVTNREDTAAN